LIERIITQAERRVLAGEAVPRREKLVSLVETHADIIVKGSREVHYGHKLNLTTGKSGLILDVVVEAGNPADAERFLPMLERHIARQGTPPRQTASDGGYASLAPVPAAPPCILQRRFPRTAGDWQGAPLRVRAPQRSVRCIDNFSHCISLLVRFVAV